MKGVFDVINHKKWVFAYMMVVLMTYLLTKALIDGNQFMMGLLALMPSVIGASSFDKSEWRKHD